MKLRDKIKTLARIRTRVRHPMSWCVLLALIASIPSFAQTVPVQVAAKKTILDEWGKPLCRDSGDLVQFLQVNGGVHPPSVDGLSHSNNPVIYTSKVGYGIIATTSTVGRFSSAIVPPPTQPIIARVFNAPTVEDASFYADSQVFYPAPGAVFYPEFGATTNALDDADDDGDGLSNSWEKSIGSDALNPDTDGDGISDYEEFLAGTNPLDAGSFLALVEMIPQSGGGMILMWASVEGKVYQLQATTNHLDDSTVYYENVNSPVAAFGDTASTEVTSDQLGAYKHFRVQLLD